MSEYIVDTFGIVQEFADLHRDMNTPLYLAIMDVMASRQREEIVRCRHCKMLVKRGNRVYCDLNQGGFPEVEPDGFCSWGERRDA